LIERLLNPEIGRPGGHTSFFARAVRRAIEPVSLQVVSYDLNIDWGPAAQKLRICATIVGQAKESEGKRLGNCFGEREAKLVNVVVGGDDVWWTGSQECRHRMCQPEAELL